MNFRKLLTYLTVGTAAVIPFAGAQNPTILQGSYISNVFGNSNFVKNPNAQTNVANVTNATRSITTPLVATSEFNLALDAGQNATWTLRAFDAGMKGQNCEARFSYRGFATATTTAEIVQNSLVVAQLVLTPSTDPRIASINFPCGDLANATTFRIAQTTANMTGTNEIGGVYTGLATNMANVAQAEMVGMVTFNNGSAGKIGSTSTWTEYDAGTWTPTVIGQGTGSNKLQIAFSYLPAGRYFVNAVINPVVYGGTSTSHGCRFGIQETTSSYVTAIKDNAATVATIYKTLFAPLNGTFDFTTGAARTFKIVVNGNGYAQSATGNCFSEQTSDDAKVQLAVYRFPTSSELVVTPERQNTWAGAQFTGGALDLTNTTIGSYVTYSNAVAASFTPFGSASASKTSCTYGGGGSVGANDVALCIPVIPPGTYKVTLQTAMFATTSTADCNFRFSDGTTGFGMLNIINERDNTLIGIIKYDALTLNRGIAVQSNNGGSGGACNLLVAATSNNRTPQFLFEPLDQPSNSALYVQGPVLGAQTGAAIPAGYVGETIQSVVEVASAATNTGATAGTLTNLPAGVWSMQVFGSVINATGVITSGSFYGIATTNCSLNPAGTQGYNEIENSGYMQGYTFDSANTVRSTATNSRIVTVTAPTTYCHRVAFYTVGGGTVGFRGYIRAVRIN